MCKILAFTNAKKLNLKKSINSIGNTLLRLERDGFGYAIQGEKGVYGEKCTANSFHTRFFTKYAVNIPVVKKNYETFGALAPVTGPGIFHGRTSTNNLGLINTHPMQRENWNLIHNGVVDDRGPKYEKRTENDSEDVLARLIEGYAGGDTNTPMQYVEKYLEGYYAFAAIDPDGRLHISRDSIATLFMAWSPIYDTYIFATTEALLRSINKTLGAKIGPVDEVEDKIYMIFQGNELIYKMSIKPLGYTARQSSYASASLGRAIDHTPTWDDDGISNWHHRGRRNNKRSKNIVADNEAAIDQMINGESKGLSEAEWIKNDKETSYYSLMREFDNVDDSYTIFSNEKLISAATFKKMDTVSKELCTVIRHDGTIVDLESHYIEDKKKLG